MPPITSEYYPPLDLDYLEDLLDISRSNILNIVADGEIKTKKMGNKIFVSNYSLNAFMDRVPTNRKEMERRVVKKYINEWKENKILTYAYLIRTMRRSNKEFTKLLNKKKELEFSQKVSFQLNSRVDTDNEIENISLDIPYSEIKKIILEVREMDLWVFDKQT